MLEDIWVESQARRTNADRQVLFVHVMHVGDADRGIALKQTDRHGDDSHNRSTYLLTATALFPDGKPIAKGFLWSTRGQLLTFGPRAGSCMHEGLPLTLVQTLDSIELNYVYCRTGSVLVKYFLMP